MSRRWTGRNPVHEFGLPGAMLPIYLYVWY